ncbi:hypothetical protein FQN53_000616 [Emmonsiellopsis sp. PD_33]|nr:hypothetical protein FQN53_000616 [Emmonsiellopsis sp. PD_33]
MLSSAVGVKYIGPTKTEKGVGHQSADVLFLQFPLRSYERLKPAEDHIEALLMFFKKRRDPSEEEVNLATIPSNRTFEKVNDSKPSKPQRAGWRRHMIWGVGYGLIVVLVAVALAIPIVIFRNDQDLDNLKITTEKELKVKQEENFLIDKNKLLAVNWNKDPDSWGWDDTIDDVLHHVTFWGAFYLAEKIVMLYIRIHFHYRGNQGKNTQSKEMHIALVTLYEASVYLYPVGSSAFIAEDTAINQETPTKDISAAGAGDFLRQMGWGNKKTSAYFGIKSESKSHWMSHSGSYAIVERALADPKASAALASRIWKSLTSEGQEQLTAEDVAEVLGPYRREEALQHFKALDKNENKGIKLEEMVWTVIEAGRIRRDIYRGMASINHCINTADWIGVLFLALVMIFFILVLYVPTIKEIQQTVSVIALGLSFAVGRTIHKFVAGCVFVFFDHPYDIGDRVEVYNGGPPVTGIVVQESILYTVFQRLDNNAIVQLPNDRLNSLRIENITRSGANKEGRSFFINVKTPFATIMALRSELETFLKENNRDYQPALGLSVASIHEMNKMELRVSFTHKENWSNEMLRAKRSNKFMCTFVATIRKLKIQSPSGTALGDEARPSWQVVVAREEVEKKAADETRKAEDELLGGATVAGDDVNNSSSLQDGEAREELLKQKKAEKEQKEKEVEEEAFEKLTKVPVSQKKLVSTGSEVDTTGLRDGTGLRRRSGVSGEGRFYP